MRHQIAGYRLGRSTGARLALRRNLIKQFFTHERITTTRAKAAAIRGDAERLITLARNSAQKSDAEKVHARRLVHRSWAITRSFRGFSMKLPRVMPTATAVIHVC
jgi:large subunit ribosomal protein L17